MSYRYGRTNFNSDTRVLNHTIHASAHSFLATRCVQTISERNDSVYIYFVI